MPHYLDELNAPQRQAAEHVDGPLMIIAGAGSGKTKVVTYRIARLMELGVQPFQILALTFTNKAAKEMRNRIELVVGADARNIWMGTFHSVFAKILRFEGEKLGYPSNFTIYDTDDSRSLLKAIIKEKGLDDKIYKPSGVHARISMAKNNLIGPAAYVGNAALLEEDEISSRPRLGEIYKAYNERMFKSGAMDFDDLLFNTNILFRDVPEVLNNYQQRFRHVMVDEYQDTNLSQYLITRKLASVHRNICVVGDDAQSIYAFRGANIQNILNFERDYPDVTVIRLEQNYRSTKNIVGAANSIIKRNEKQLRKEVWTANAEGNAIEVLHCLTDTEEAKTVATTIFEEKMRDGYKNKDFAILYRTNAQSRTFEEALRNRNLRYRIIGGTSFYQRKEIKDVLGYMRLVVNQNDEEAFKRIINLPKRGIGDTTVAKLFVIAEENGVSLWEVVSKVGHVFKGRTAEAIENFATLIRHFQLQAEKLNAADVARMIAKDSGLQRELFDDKSPEGVARYENVQELLNAVQAFVDNSENEDKSLGMFLQNVSLMTDADKTPEGEDAITMMTIHAAKGLEFKSVFVVGMEEDLFPSTMRMQSQDDLEEERRLFYVALTRAEIKLRLSFAETRYKYGMIKPSEPSRFLKEIEPQYIKAAPKPVREENAPRPTSFVNQFKGKSGAAPKPTVVTHSVSDNFIPSAAKDLKAGQRVEHPKFGFGTVQEVDANGADLRARVVFDSAGERTLILTFAKLMIVG